MKKLVLFLILPIVLSSCGAKRVTPDELLAHQGCDLSCVYYAEDFVAEIEIKQTDDSMKVTYLSPESLSGLSFDVHSEGVSLELDGTLYPLDAEREGHLLKIYELLNIDRSDYKRIETSNGGISYEGTFLCDVGEVCLSYDMRSCRTTLIIADGFELEISELEAVENNETTDTGN